MTMTSHKIQGISIVLVAAVPIATRFLRGGRGNEIRSTSQILVNEKCYISFFMGYNPETLIASFPENFGR